MDDSNPIVAILLVLLTTAPLWLGGVGLLWRLVFGATTGGTDDEATQHALRRLRQTGAADRLLGVGWSIAPSGRDAEFNSDAGVLGLIVTRRLPLVGPKGKGPSRSSTDVMARASPSRARSPRRRRRRRSERGLLA